jgi:hypothetical protein
MSGLVESASVPWRRHSCRRVMATFQSPVPCAELSLRGTRDWKVPSTRRLESLRYAARAVPPAFVEVSGRQEAAAFRSDLTSLVDGGIFE